MEAVSRARTEYNRQEKPQKCILFPLSYLLNVFGVDISMVSLSSMHHVSSNFFKKFYGRYVDLFMKYGSISNMLSHF